MGRKFQFTGILSELFRSMTNLLDYAMHTFFLQHPQHGKGSRTLLRLRRRHAAAVKSSSVTASKPGPDTVRATEPNSVAPVTAGTSTVVATTTGSRTSSLTTATEPTPRRGLGVESHPLCVVRSHGARGPRPLSAERRRPRRMRPSSTPRRLPGQRGVVWRPVGRASLGALLFESRQALPPPPGWLWRDAPAARVARRLPRVAAGPSRRPAAGARARRRAPSRRLGHAHPKENVLCCAV